MVIGGRVGGRWGGGSTREAERWWSETWSAHGWRSALRCEHGVCAGLAFGGVGGGDGVDY